MLRAISTASLLMLILTATPGAADDECGKFSWPVAHERRLFAETAKTVAGGPDADSAPAIKLNRAYDVILMPEDVVRFAAPRGQELLSTSGYGGLLKFSVPRAGLYRVSLDLPFWVDVIARDGPIKSGDSQEQEDCNAPHTVIEYQLPGRTTLILQLSGNSNTRVRLTVTATPSAAQ